ncbi:MAG: CocE/NonD family hydrolase [Steroidobacteraceae bacterium]
MKEEAPAFQSIREPEQKLQSQRGGISRRSVLAGLGAASCLALEGSPLRARDGGSPAPALSSLGIGSAAAAEAATGRMLVQNDVPIPMMDGVSLLANVYRPPAAGRYPVIVTISSYGKDNRPTEALSGMLHQELKFNPAFCSPGSSCRYLTWETPDPERWVPDGYVVVNVDSRGAGRTPGYLDPYSPQETRDYYDAIEWAGVQPWSNGKVGLLGLSYYAVVQWHVAALRPPHLAAMIPWEGFNDYYRDATHQGGILCTSYWHVIWWPLIVRRNQHGNPGGFINSVTGRHTNGPLLNPQLLPGNRIHLLEQFAAHHLDDEWMKAYSPILERIEVPLLSAGNWGGLGHHLRGNTDGYQRSSSKNKWLNMHTGLHFKEFYSPEGHALQKRFLDHFCKGIDNGWDREPRFTYIARHPHGNSVRSAADFPVPGTQWTRYYLDARSRTMNRHRPGSRSSASYRAMASAGVSFTTPPFAKETEITGPVSAKLWVSSSTEDMDLFLTLRAFAPDGKEYTFHGADDPAAPVTQGWLRVSHRQEDPAGSRPGQPWHTHLDRQMLTPGSVYPVDVEIWPTNVVLPVGYRLMLVVEGKDFERPGPPPMVRDGIPYGGSGQYLHTDRDPVLFGGTSTIVTGASYDSHLLLPIVQAS